MQKKDFKQPSKIFTVTEMVKPAVKSTSIINSRIRLQRLLNSENLFPGERIKDNSREIGGARFEHGGGQRWQERLRYGAFALTINRDTPRSSGHRFSDNHSIGYF